MVQGKFGEILLFFVCHPPNRKSVSIRKILQSASSTEAFVHSSVVREILTWSLCPVLLKLASHEASQFFVNQNRVPFRIWKLTNYLSKLRYSSLIEKKSKFRGQYLKTTIISNSFSHCHYQKDKWAKPWNLTKLFSSLLPPKYILLSFFAIFFDTTNK
jgi:hypothetical protein